MKYRNCPNCGKTKKVKKDMEQIVDFYISNNLIFPFNAKMASKFLFYKHKCKKK